MGEPPEVVVAGHICLDIIPEFDDLHSLESLLRPGRLVTVGPVVVAAGGPVANAGLVLHRLGVRTSLMGKVGDDHFGRMIRAILSHHSSSLTENLIVMPGEQTSYSIVISAPGRDRIFLHSPGANDTFGAGDVDPTLLDGVRLLHFGYPPVMRRMYADGGAELAALLRRVKQAGPATSLDMSTPDPDSESGRADWRRILQSILRLVDVFLPSIEELLYMADRPRYLDLAGRGDLLAAVEGSLLTDLSGEMLDWGAAVVGLKLGNRGLYVRTTADPERLASMGPAAPAPSWLAREVLIPSYQAEVVGTTGAGDATFAGFLAGMLAGSTVERAMSEAAAVGAFCVSQPDGTAGIPSWAEVQQRLGEGWPQNSTTVKLPDWQWDEETSLWRGLHDRGGEAG